MTGAAFIVALSAAAAAAQPVDPVDFRAKAAVACTQPDLASGCRRVDGAVPMPVRGCEQAQPRWRGLGAQMDIELGDWLWFEENGRRWFDPERFRSERNRIAGRISSIAGVLDAEQGAIMRCRRILYRHRHRL